MREGRLAPFDLLGIFGTYDPMSTCPLTSFFFMQQENITPTPHKSFLTSKISQQSLLVQDTNARESASLQSPVMRPLLENDDWCHKYTIKAELAQTKTHWIQIISNKISPLMLSPSPVIQEGILAIIATLTSSKVEAHHCISLCSRPPFIFFTHNLDLRVPQTGLARFKRRNRSNHLDFECATSVRGDTNVKQITNHTNQCQIKQLLTGSGSIVARSNIKQSWRDSAGP